ncbi:MULTISPECIES: hypothetical protein [unclassified Actinoplanes]|uniref:hypothetical protein n=1 Tax=unclassified Actinoplanes TaxID=2626549 RepID=UPI00031AA74A|nr:MULTISPECIES: hypothetical protein [unclassified Actinoplanes]
MTGQPAEFPYEVVTQHVQRTGKHHLAAPLIEELDRTRQFCRAGGGVRLRFLDCLLDKHDGTYRYATYLSLPVLRGLVDGPDAVLSARDLAGLLIADVMRFELEALHGRHDLLPHGRPPLRTVKKRLHHGLGHLDRHSDRVPAARHLDPAAPEQADELLASLPVSPCPLVRERLAMTVHPVHVLHDEYLFIRVLQSYETIFTGLVGSAGHALTGLRAADAGATCAHLDDAATALERAGLLFTLLATMDPDAFRHFRDFTEGASAIQSEHYKRFELTCGTPRDERLMSPAFGNVPDVLDQARRGPDTITRAYLDARRDRRFGTGEQLAVDAGLTRLERAHQRWKSTHHSLATRMLGDATGSGYTAGVPYLKDCLDNRLFWGLGVDLTVTAAEVSGAHVA